MLLNSLNMLYCVCDDYEKSTYTQVNTNKTQSRVSHPHRTPASAGEDCNLSTRPEQRECGK